MCIPGLGHFRFSLGPAPVSRQSLMITTIVSVSVKLQSRDLQPQDAIFVIFPRSQVHGFPKWGTVPNEEESFAAHDSK